MRFHTTPTQLAGAVIAACATAALAVSASPAAAKASDGYVRGYDAWQGDWSDEGILSESSYSSSNATCMRQRILVAEGAPKPSGILFSNADIDGHFGPNTTHATKWLQWRYGLVESPSKADGRVGPNTLGKAEDKLVMTAGLIYRGYTITFRFEGMRANTTLERDSEGRYKFADGSLNWRTAGYNSPTCT